jgi:hypothetical protein
MSIKNSYQINSIVYDILLDFNGRDEDIDENTYMVDLTEHINKYCIENFDNDTAYDIINETYENPIIYFTGKVSNLGSYTANQLLRLSLFERLIGEITVEALALVQQKK